MNYRVTLFTNDHDDSPTEYEVRIWRQDAPNMWVLCDVVARLEDRDEAIAARDAAQFTMHYFVTHEQPSYDLCPQCEGEDLVTSSYMKRVMGI